ncbi:MAG: hypothetical protein ABJH72_05170 [Reichenbachiella sp.]|uniref:hypothetical protein n=1 Tax=Reichenbachiella sp. TaxID=2184521 RepID=UPI003266723C
MKYNIALYATLTFAAFSLGSCSDDDEATCANDKDICTVEVTVCCTSETECTYLVGDTEYATLEEANQSTECTASKAPGDQKGSVVEGLKALTVQAKANI